MHKLFIYGTLKRGFPNYDPEMKGAHYVGEFQTVQPFPLIIGGKWLSPCLINEPGEGHRVLGELFEVNEEQLKSLDHLEATHLPNGYKRIMISIENTSRNEILEAGVYVKNRDAIDVIHSQLMEKYEFDERYIAPSKRSIPNSAPGGWS